MICNKCGTQIPDGSIFCISCGAELGCQREKMKLAAEISVLQYLFMIIISFIPLLNIVFWIIWIVGNKDSNKKNFSIACILLIVLFIVISIALGGMVTELITTNYYPSNVI